MDVKGAGGIAFFWGWPVRKLPLERADACAASGFQPLLVV